MIPRDVVKLAFQFKEQREIPFIFDPSREQAAALTVYALKREYGKDLRLWGGLGCQSTLLSTPEAVRQEVRRLKRELGRGGGYILNGAKSIGTMSDTPIPNVIAYLEEALNQDC